MERRRRAVARWEAFEDASMTDQVDQGRDYVRGTDEPKPDGKYGYHTLKPFIEHRQRLLREAYPEQFTPEAERARAIQASEERWAQLESLLGGQVMIA